MARSQPTDVTNDEHSGLLPGVGAWALPRLRPPTIQYLVFSLELPQPTVR